MSYNFYAKDHAVQNRFVMFNGVGTAAIWTPTTSTKVVLTGLAVASNLGGTIEFTWGNLNINDRRIFTFFVGTSASIFPVFNAIEGTMYDRAIFANVSQSGSYGWHITATGFELE